MKHFRIVLTALSAAILLASTLAGGAGPYAESEALYDDLAAELVAPCCWKESLAQHRSPAADAARAELRAQIAEGKSEDEIRARFVAQYGERILLTPEGNKALALFWAPALAILAGLAAGVFALRKWMRRRPAPAGGPPAGFDLDDSEWDW